MSVSSYLLYRSPMMRVVLAASIPIWTVFTGTPSLTKGCTQDVDVESCWRELDGTGSWPLSPTVVSRAAARAWSFSSAETPASQSPWTLRTLFGDGIYKTKYP
jgi:hypothetical protein